MAGDLKALRLQTAQQFLSYYKPFKTENILAVRSDDCKFIGFPRAVGVLDWDNDMTKEFYDQVEDAMSHMDVDVYRMIDDPEQRTLDIWITMHVHWKQHLGIEPYTGPYVWGLEFSPDQRKVSKFIEHVDNARTPVIWQKYCDGQKKLGKPPFRLLLSKDDSYKGPG